MEKLYGNAIVGQSGGPTTAINATLAGVIRGAIECDAIKTVYGAKNGIEGVLKKTLIDVSNMTEEDLKLLENTPAAALGSCRKKLPKDFEGENRKTFEDIIAVFKEFDIRYFFYIGGNDSMDTVMKLDRHFKENGIDIKVIGIPKTIDNDLPETDHTPGFGSAAKYVATSIQEITRDSSVYSIASVTIVEIMGRDTGWLTASSAILHANGEISPHLIYLPEKPFSIKQFIEDIREAQKKHYAVIVAVSEGISLSEEDIGEAFQSGNVDNFGHKYLSGVGKALEKIVAKELKCKVRSIELNVMQRCSSHLSSKRDITEAERIAGAAVKVALDGHSGKMMIFKRVANRPYNVKIEFVDVEKVANRVKYFPNEWINEAGNGVTKEAIEYCLPLIQGEQNFHMQNGIPKQYVLKCALPRDVGSHEP